MNSYRTLEYQKNPSTKVSSSKFLSSKTPLHSRNPHGWGRNHQTCQLLPSTTTKTVCFQAFFGSLLPFPKDRYSADSTCSSSRADDLISVCFTTSRPRQIIPGRLTAGTYKFTPLEKEIPTHKPLLAKTASCKGGVT